MNFSPELKSYFRTRWQEDYSSFIDALSQSPSTSLRANLLKSYAPDKESSSVEWATNAYYLPERPVFTLDPDFHAGAYYVQEASSMILEQVVKQLIPETDSLKVLDLCAAPGGKTTHLLDILGPASMLVANEVIKSRSHILAENVIKWGRHNAIVTHNDPRDFQLLEGFFDLLVVDAPCSGEGMFRKNPKAIEEWAPEHVCLCVDRQRRILMDVWDCLKPGGILIYSTCTYNPQENEQNLAWFQERVQGESIEMSFEPGWQIEEILYQGIYGYGLYPHKVKGEGLFISAIRKEEGKVWKPNRKKKGQSYFEKPAKAIDKTITSWIESTDELQLVQIKDTISGFPQAVLNEFESLYRYLRVVYGGIGLAEVKRKDLRPKHSLAMYAHAKQESFLQKEVGKEEALTFLRKSPWNIQLDKGWHLISYQGSGLGWVKSVPGRVNNYYPQQWRIRMQSS